MVDADRLMTTDVDTRLAPPASIDPASIDPASIDPTAIDPAAIDPVPIAASSATVATSIDVSVVVPVYNEEAGLHQLFARLYASMDAIALARGIRYEIVFVNDGSRDRSAAILSDQFRARPDVTRVVLFNANYGQHAAIMAGFQHTRGACIITLDADLQNPPEEIGKLIDAMAAGHDYVGTIRRARQDAAWRKTASRAMNRLRERITHITMTDQGCMLRAYDRRIVETINACRESNTFIPALAYTFANNPVEIEVGHAERAAGESKYSLYALIRLNFDLVTGFSVLPLQVFSLFGAVLSIASALLVLVLALRRIFFGPEAEGLFTLFGIAFFLIGVTLLGIGLLGEYVGRIYEEVRERPRWIVQGVLEKEPPVDIDRPMAAGTLFTENPVR
jgi:undecaprenyl-phosphate 4-deoxy-4-formamido-L-arabinose transferase